MREDFEYMKQHYGGLKMRRLFAVLIMCFATASWAGRVVPPDMNVAVLQQVSYPQVVLSPDGFSWLRVFTLGWLQGSTAYEAVEGVRIRDENNRFIVKKRLPAKVGKPVAVRMDNGQRIVEIWVLSPDEQAYLRERAKKQ